MITGINIKTMQMEKNDKHMIDSKVEEIQSILSYLEKEYGVNYSVFLTKNDNNPSNDFKKSFNSDFLSNGFVTFLREGLQTIINRSVYIPNLINQGYNIVECIDNRDRPNNIDPINWLDNGEIYIVRDIVKTIAGTFYRLQTKDGQVSSLLFSIRRFKKFYNQETMQ